VVFGIGGIMSHAIFKEYDATLTLMLDDVRDPATKVARDAVLQHMAARGFRVENDSSVPENIRQDYHYAIKDAIECKITLSGRSLEMKFYQNVVKENRHGGEYDFSRRSKMPPLIGKQYELERNKLVNMMGSLGYTFNQSTKLLGMDFINSRRAELCSFQRKDMYSEPPHGGNANSAEKEPLTDGDTVYTKGPNGRWRTGIVYHNINNMWWLIFPCKTVTNVGSYECHLTAPAELRGRHFCESTRKRRQMDAIHNMVRKGNIRRVTALRTMLTPDKSFYVLSLKHTGGKDPAITLWGQSDGGYRYSIGAAGKYSEAEILESPNYYNDGGNIAVDAETVERLATISSNKKDTGNDGEPILLNIPENWYGLMAATIAKPTHSIVPEVFAVVAKKARRKKVAA
jgi:hypothetical protein